MSMISMIWGSDYIFERRSSGSCRHLPHVRLFTLISYKQ